MQNFASLLKGSRWTLQATNMDGNFVRMEMNPNLNIFLLTTANWSCSNDFVVSAGVTGDTAWSDAGKLRVYIMFAWTEVLDVIGENCHCAMYVFKRLSTPSWSWLWCPSWTVPSTLWSKNVAWTSRKFSWNWVRQPQVTIQCCSLCHRDYFTLMGLFDSIYF